MNRQILWGVLTALLIAAVLPSFASEYGIVEDRVREQHQLIRQNLSSGLITAHEADMLEYNLDRIASREAKLKSSGNVSEQEILKLHVLLDHNSDMLARKRVYGVKKLF